MKGSLQQFKDKMARAAHGMTKRQALDQFICISCKKDMRNAEMSVKDWKEYNISGYCNVCWEKL